MQGKFGLRFLYCCLSILLLVIMLGALPNIQPAQALTATLPPKSTTLAPPVTSLKVQYKAADTVAGDNQFKPHFNIINGGSAAVPLSELKIRYYFTREAGGSLVFNCDYAVAGCANLTGTFVAISPAVTGADTYLEVGFKTTAPSIPAGGSSGEIQTRENKSDFTNFNESDDYSFDPTKTAFADWAKVALYRNDTLVWGTPPGGTVITNTPTASLTTSPTRSLTPSATGQIITNTSTAPSGALPDLIITRIYYAPPDPACSVSNGKSVTVQNQGNATAGSFVVHYSGSTTDQTVTGLAAGQIITLFFRDGSQGGTVSASADVLGQVAESNETNNTYSTMLPVLTQPIPCTPGPTNTFTPTSPAGPLPDLVIRAMYDLTVGFGCYDSNRTALVTVANTGNATAGAFIVRVTGATVQEQQVLGLGAGQSMDLYFAIKPATATTPISGVVDPTNSVVEINENNNTNSYIVPQTTPGPTCTPSLTPTNTPGTTTPTLPDLTISNITNAPSTVPCGPGWNAATNVIVANLGGTNAGSFVVSLNTATQTVTGLAAGQSITLRFAGNGGNFTATADSTNVIVESNETNNSMTKTLPVGDPPPCTPTPTPVTPGGALPDLTITSAQLVNTTYNGTCATDISAQAIRAVITNNSTVNAGAFVVKINSQQFNMGFLAAGQSTTLDGPVASPNQVAVDTTNVVTESNETNNTLTFSSPTATPPVKCTATPSPTALVTCPVARCIEVDITDTGFLPASVSFVSNMVTQIRWTNKGTMNHTVTFTNCMNCGPTLPASGSLAPGQSFTLTITTNVIGGGSYHCDFHSNMTGSVNFTQPTMTLRPITVTPSATSTATPTLTPSRTPTTTPPCTCTCANSCATATAVAAMTQTAQARTITPTHTNTPGTVTPTRTNTPVPGLTVQIKNNGAETNQQTPFAYVVKNTSSSTISNVSVRIYFTLDGTNAASNYTLEKYYDQSGVATVSAPTLATGSTYYFTVSYGTASLAAGAQWEFQTSLHLANWGTTYSGANDWYHTGYAANALPAAYTTTNYVPAYVSGTLSWGTTP